MKFFISTNVRQKLLAKHNVSEKEVQELFSNRAGKDLFDKRAQHLTNPLTRWFIAQTNTGRTLKVCFMYHDDAGIIEIKSAFPPDAEEVRIYNKYSR